MIDDEIKYILKLLDDPDENVYNEIKLKIIERKTDFKDILVKQWSYNNELLNKRIEEVVEEIHFNESVEELLKFKENQYNNFLESILIIENFFHRFDNTEVLRNKFIRLIHKIWIELNNQLTALEKIKIINNIIFSIHNFKTTSLSKDKHKLIKLSTLFIDKIFVDQTISTFYYILANKLNIPIYILNFKLSDITILGYVDKNLSKKIFSNNDVVFYIFPSLNGEICTQNQLINIAERKKIKIELKKIKPLENNLILKEWLNFKLSNIQNKEYNKFVIDNAKKLINIF